MKHEASGSFYPLPTLDGNSAASLDAESVLTYLNEFLSNHLDSKGLKREDSGGQLPSHDPTKRGDPVRHLGLALDHWVAQAYAERRLRDEVFNDPEIFGEPAWDALLDIARAEARGERLAVTSACIGSCVPPTTALRWLKILEERDLVRREADECDARRSFVRLTKEGRKKVELYFQGVKRLRSSQAAST